MRPRFVVCRKGRFVVAVGAVTVVSAVLAVSGARGDLGPGAVHGSVDLTGAVLDCSADTVTLSGTYRYTEAGFVNQVRDGTWFSHGSLSFNLAGVIGTGASGVSYRVVGATQIGYSFFFGSDSPGTDVEHSTQEWHLVPSGGGTPLSFKENFGFVVTPSGSTTLVDHGSSDCD